MLAWRLWRCRRAGRRQFAGRWQSAVRARRCQPLAAQGVHSIHVRDASKPHAGTAACLGPAGLPAHLQVRLMMAHTAASRTRSSGSLLGGTLGRTVRYVRVH